MFQNNSVYWWREQAKKCDWSFWKSCKKPCFLYVCFLSRPSFHPFIQPTIQPSIHPSLPSSQKSCLSFLEILFFNLLPISANSDHVSFPWIPLRCSVWPIVSLESRWQWKKLKWSLSIQKCQRLVISQITILDYYEELYLAAKLSPLKIAAKYSYGIVLCSNLWLLWNVVLTLLYKTPPTAATSKMLL